jgi:two-component system, OmpR family, phosphate regulon sensor histidine kinase PhoR
VRGFLLQVAVPPAVSGSVFLAGYIAGFPVAGLLLGVAIGIGFAARVGLNARDRINQLADLSQPGAVRASSMYPSRTTTDEIDRAYTRIASRLRALEQAHDDELADLARQIQLLDRMNDGIMRVDAHGVVTYANVAAGALFRGRNPTGRSFIAVTGDHELNDLVQENLRSGEDQQHTFEIPGDNSVFNAVITRLEQTPPESLIVLRDITEVTRLQTLRRDFVGNVSHDLRTPLSAIKIMTETLLDLRAGDADSERFLGKIDDEVNVMTVLVNDLLDLASLEGREGNLTIRDVDIHHLIEEVRERMEPIADRHDVTLLVRVDANLGRIEADERRVHQVLVNLAHNAIVHTPAGGRVEIMASTDGRFVTFEVRDTGIGIHPDDLPRVWERFFKADRARSGRGTGLGLAIVKHVVLAHGGEMSASSEPGRGSEFRVSFPVTQRSGTVAGMGKRSQTVTGSDSRSRIS